MAASKAALRKSVTVLFWSSMTFWNEENTMSRVGNSFSMSSFKRLRLSSCPARVKGKVRGDCGLHIRRQPVHHAQLTAFLISLEVSAQNVRVSGVVTDALGPIPGVNIMEEGTTNGTVTDVNGKYSISVSAKSTLVFSCIGYKEQKIRVGTKTVLNVNMVEESKMLDELVVVGYGVQRKSDVLLSSR